MGRVRRKVCTMKLIEGHISTADCCKMKFLTVYNGTAHNLEILHVSTLTCTIFIALVCMK